MRGGHRGEEDTGEHAWRQLGFSYMYMYTYIKALRGSEGGGGGMRVEERE